MITRHPARRRPALALAAGLLSAGLLLGAAPATAATQPDEAATLSPEARYRADRAACIEGRTGQDRTTCLREAGAALAEARQRPTGVRTPDHAANALARCDRLPEADRTDCRLRMQGRGSRQGSVAGGGILYQMVTKTVGAPAPAASAP